MHHENLKDYLQGWQRTTTVAFGTDGAGSEDRMFELYHVAMCPNPGTHGEHEDSW